MIRMIKEQVIFVVLFKRWVKMILDLMAQVIDIGVGPFSVTYSRSKAVDFTVPFYEEPTGILIPPPAEDNRLLACTKPFRLEVGSFD